MSTPAPLPQGVFVDHHLEAAVEAGILRLSGPALPGQIQPASLDLTLGAEAWRVRAAFLPGASHTVAERLEGGMALHQLDLSGGAVLEKGCVYVVRLREGITLPRGLKAHANPKSSTGRIDVFVRLVTDNGTAYEKVPPGYKGPLYAEISPRTFSILVREGSRLNQLRLSHGECRLTDEALATRQIEEALVTGGTERIGGGLHMSVDLSANLGEVVGYRARRHSGLIDVDKVGALNVADYWEPIGVPQDGFIILDPDEFYILASREHLKIPGDVAAEMLPIDTELGAFRVHYAGFFDPGFGTGRASRAVLEVRGYDAPFLLDHGQTVAKLTYERLTEAPSASYGEARASNYDGQGLKLSKHFG